MDKPKWSKEVALEIIQAGFLRMSKKYHPDVGGTHEQILVLQETKMHLERIMDGKATHETYTYQRAREEPRKSTYTGRSRYWNRADEYTGEVPLEPYLDDADYVQISDVIIMSSTEKAVRFKIPGVKVGQWLPKSQMLYDEDTFLDGEVTTVVFTKWIAKQKNWMK